jgi:hypothetical protein
MRTQSKERKVIGVKFFFRLYKCRKQIKYTYKQDGKFMIGHIDEYPEYPTQAFSIDELEANLQDIYEMINDGTLEVRNKHGIMELAV